MMQGLHRLRFSIKVKMPDHIKCVYAASFYLDLLDDLPDKAAADMMDYVLQNMRNNCPTGLDECPAMHFIWEEAEVLDEAIGGVE